MPSIRRCRADEREPILAIVNAAAEAYRGAIPADRWHEPYMPARELDGEIEAGVEFWGYEADGELVGIMGIQPVGDVQLIRHAYVSPASQRHGIGGALLEHLAQRTSQRMLVGTWAAAESAIAFYRRHGFELVGPERHAELLRAYWSIPDRQIATSVVLARPPLDARSTPRILRMSDESIAARIERLVAEEHDLRADEQKDSPDPDALEADRERLRAVEVELDRCWDLLRQRRARSEFGLDPDDASARGADTVENYEQ